MPTMDTQSQPVPDPHTLDKPPTFEIAAQLCWVGVYTHKFGGGHAYDWGRRRLL